MTTLKEEFKEIMAQFKNRNGEIITDFERVTNDVLSRFASEIKESKQAVECDNFDKWEFITKHRNINWGGDWFKPKENKTEYIWLVDYPERSDPRNCKDIQILQFQDYLKAENLQQKYDNFRLEKAKREYPEGTRFIGVRNGAIRKSDGLTDVYKGYIRINHGYVCKLESGKWAEKLTPIFTTEDNVKWYENSGDYVVVDKKTLSVNIKSIHPYSGDSSNAVWYFSTTKAAKEFVKKEKERREKKVILDEAKMDAHLGDILEKTVTDDESFMKVMRILAHVYSKSRD
jgi:hypothetical protein